MSVAVSGPVLREIKSKAGAAVYNETLTRGRVDNLETAMTAVLGVLGRGFWGRLRWLMTGR